MSAKVSNAKRLKDVKATLRGLRESHGAAIDKGEFLRITGHVVRELEWAVAEIDRLTGAAPAADEPDEEEAA